MNEELNIDDFENWLKSQADKHRMYPSDKLWRNIRQEIHEHERWPALTFGAVLTGALVTAALIFLHPTKAIFDFPAKPVTVEIAQSNTISAHQQKVTAAIKKLKPVYNQKDFYTFNTSSSELTNEEFTDAPDALITNSLSNQDYSNSLPASYASSVNNSTKPEVLLNAAPTTALLAEDFVDNNAFNTANVAAQATGKNGSAIPDTVESLEESTGNNFSKIQLPETRKSKWHLELYGGPNVSYRRLTEPVSFDYHQPYSPAYTSNSPNKVNNFVKQRPSVGFNAGAAITYSVSNRIRVKAGLQFNYRQYNINAFHSNTERSVLLLNNGLYYPDSVYTYSAISNGQGGSNPITLSNRYFQLGVPVGLEWTVAKMNKVHLQVSATVQPTYQLNDNVYQITSDYKTYVQAPDLLRRLNINAGAEASVVFTTSTGLQWSAGPQILYQTLPTQKDNYSIRERMFDYGIRVGVIKKLR